ncbi:MAG: DUF805 domain-containing protein [Rhodobacteraceae bacterium]|nr:DUF805 domain-containing protein [Paracoccaceae bacterium]
MGMVEAVRTCFRKYATFRGRAARSEYWWFVLFNVIVSAVIAAIFPPVAVDMGATAGESMMEAYAMVKPSVPSAIWSLFVLLPGLAVAVRRLHDGDKSGWWLLLAFIPVIGAIILLVWFVTRGTRGDNSYGPDPLAGQGA